jgi:hypothetical protein
MLTPHATCHLPTSYIYPELATQYIDNKDRMAQWSLRALRDAKPDDKTSRVRSPTSSKVNPRLGIS